MYKKRDSLAKKGCIFYDWGILMNWKVPSLNKITVLLVFFFLIVV